MAEILSQNDLQELEIRGALSLSKCLIALFLSLPSIFFTIQIIKQFLSSGVFPSIPQEFMSLLMLCYILTVLSIISAINSRATLNLSKSLLSIQSKGLLGFLKTQATVSLDNVISIESVVLGFDPQNVNNTKFNFTYSPSNWSLLFTKRDGSLERLALDESLTPGILTKLLQNINKMHPEIKINTWLFKNTSEHSEVYKSNTKNATIIVIILVLIPLFVVILQLLLNYFGITR